MKSLQIRGIILLALIMLTALAVKFVMPGEQKSPYITRIEDQERAKDIRFYGAAARRFSVVAPSVILLTIFVGVCCWGRARIKKASVHIYKIDESEIVVHERDLHIAHQVAMGLINAKQLKEYNAGTDRAFQLSMQIADIQTRHFKALSQGTHRALQAIPDVPPDQHAHFETPTFQALMSSGMIQSGKPMILGFENGTPRHGSFLDIYSAAVAGESGSGKTGTLLYLIGSGIIADRVRFYGIDPHYPHPKSLGYKTKPLWEAGLMCMATYIDDMLDVFNTVETIIDNRLQQIDTDETPVVLVIDELAFLNKTSIGKPLAHAMERISTEGRKCAVYMLASSQTWLVARTGDSSVVRDTLTSAYVHKIKPKQANLLLQSKETSQMVEKYVKKPGECLLYPVCDDPVICTMPLTTEQDMLHVANMVDPIFVNQTLPGMVNNQVNTTVNGQQPVDQALTADLSDVDLIERVKNRLTQPGDQGRLADKFDYDRGLFSKVLNGGKKIPPKLREKMIQEVKPADVIPFRK
jgi:hypothetical protein